MELKYTQKYLNRYFVDYSYERCLSEAPLIIKTMKHIIKKSVPKKDIGNLNNKEFGCELDPNNNLCLSEDSDKGQQAYYKGSKMKYMDYMQEVTDRIDRNKKGKGADNIGFFGGVNFDKNGKIIKS